LALDEYRNWWEEDIMGFPFPEDMISQTRPFILKHIDNEYRAQRILALQTEMAKTQERIKQLNEGGAK
jgi:hypothetical protein